MSHLELFVGVPGWEGKYLISTHGRVFSIRSNKCLSLNKVRGDYLMAHFYDDGKQESEYVHKLVAECFLAEQPAEMSEVNHKDGNSLNNHVSNLEWIRPWENRTHALVRKLVRVYGKKEARTRLGGWLSSFDPKYL